MKKFYFLMAAALAGSATMSAKTTWNTQTLGTVEVDTLYHAQVGPGTTQTQIRITYGDARTSTITYSTTDLTNPYVTLKVGMASKAPYGKPQRVNSMMKNRTKYMNHYMVGINGDFAGLESTQSIPCGAVMEDGNLITTGATLTGNIFSNYLVIDKDGKPQTAETISFSGYGESLGTITYPDGKVVNQLRNNADNRWADYLIAYNEFYGYGKSTGIGYTSTNQWGLEAELIPVTTNVTYGNEAEFTVGRIDAAGDMKVPHGGLVISGTNAEGGKVTHMGDLQNLKTGDVVKIKHQFTADGKQMSARELLGGFALTVKDGKVQELPAEVPSDIAAKTPRARTAVGYNADKTRFIMAVVQEETSGGKNGMRIIEFGDVLASLGCTEAINLDGGGSSVMFVENLGQRSAVQGKGGNGVSSYTRAVANGLFAVNTAPEDGEVASIAFVDRHVTIQPGRGYQPVIYAYNQYGSLISTGLQNYKLSAPEATFDASGRKMIAPASGKFTLTATYEGHTASIPVYVDAEGISGSDPATAPEFKGDEFVPVLKDPNAPIAPEDRIYAELEDVTPAGYDFDKYEAGTLFPVADITVPAEGETFYNAPAYVWNDDNFKSKGQISAIMPYPLNAETYGIRYESYKGAYSIQDLGGNIGKCLVFARQWGPGLTGWPKTSNDSYGGVQFSFYSDKELRNKGNKNKAMRVRIVFQVLKRARQDYNATTNIFNSQRQIGNIYATANKNGNSSLALFHDDVENRVIGAEYPLYGSDFYRWENEGTTIATMPEEKVLQDWMGKPEPWDGNGTNNPYCINAERFLVYEFDCYSDHDGAIGVHINMGNASYSCASHNTIVIKEVKFFNIINNEEILAQPRAKAAARAANKEGKFTTNTACGSLLNTRHISYRYYTEDGVKEFDTDPDYSGVDDVIENTDNAPAEYYNLQGIRVSQPAPGQIYIKRQGDRASKVLMR